MADMGTTCLACAWPVLKRRVGVLASLMAQCMTLCSLYVASEIMHTHAAGVTMALSRAGRRNGPASADSRPRSRTHEQEHPPTASGPRRRTSAPARPARVPCACRRAAHPPAARFCAAARTGTSRYQSWPRAARLRRRFRGGRLSPSARSPDRRPGLPLHRRQESRQPRSASARTRAGR
jgi:hypothetical protein